MLRKLIAFLVRALCESGSRSWDDSIYDDVVSRKIWLVDRRSNPPFEI